MDQEFGGGPGYRRVPAARMAGYRRNGWWVPHRIEEEISRTAGSLGGKVALVDTTGRMTYARLWQLVDRTAAVLSASGIRVGSRVAVQMDNRVELVVALLGAMRAGAVPVPVMPSLGSREVGHVVDTARAAALLVAPPPHAGARRAVRQWEKLAPHLSTAMYEFTLPDDGNGAPLRPLNGGATRPDEAADQLTEVAVMLLSSGTTGPPKLIPREHGSFGYMIRRAGELSGFSEDSVYLAVLPATHGFTLDCPGVLGTLQLGGTVVLGDHRNPTGALDLIAGEGVTHTTVVPAVARQWLIDSERMSRTTGSLDVVQIGGARPSQELMRSLEAASDAYVQQVYGMSEGLLCFTERTDSVVVRHGTQGRPASPGDELRLVPPSENGDGTAELWTRGPYTVAGYFNDPVADGRSFSPDGFYRTGDLAVRTADGSVTIAGRDADVINRGGENICPEELEEALRAHPEVEDVAVVGKPDPMNDEVISVFVVAPEWFRPSLSALRGHLRSMGFAEFKLPESVSYVPEIPKIGIGKIDRKRLRATVQGQVTHA